SSRRRHTRFSRDWSSDVCSSDLVHCNANIQNVIIEISGKRLGVTAVLDEEELAGIITDGDIRRMLQNNNQFMQLKAEDIMTPNRSEERRVGNECRTQMCTDDETE